MKNIKQANINITLKRLFKKWLEITISFHKLTNREQEILALFLYYHHVYSNEITNNKILWDVLFDYSTRIKIIKELGIKDQAIYNALTKFRKNKIIVNNEITPYFIPNIEFKSNNFKVIFNFNIIHEE